MGELYAREPMQTAGSVGGNGANDLPMSETYRVFICIQGVVLVYGWRRNRLDSTQLPTLSK